MQVLVWALWGQGAIAHAGTAVGVGVGAASAPYRDQQLSSVRRSGGGLTAQVSLDTLDAPGKLDRLTLDLLVGGEPDWPAQAVVGRWNWAPQIAMSGRARAFLGMGAEIGVTRRTWRDATGWHARGTVGPALGVRLPLVEGAQVWTGEVVATAPLLGVVGRPGQGDALQSSSLSARDFALASLHNHRAARLAASVLWVSPSGTALRLEADIEGRTIPWRHPVAEARYGLTLLAYLGRVHPPEEVPHAG